jgi:hypothetical protein
MCVNKHCVYYCSKSKTIHGGTPVQTIMYMSITKGLCTLITLPFCNLFKVHYSPCQGYARLANWLKEEKKMSSMNKSCEEKKQQQHIVKIFYMWMFCITLKGRNTFVFGFWSIMNLK